MSLASGTVEYTLGSMPVTCFGVSWTAEEMDAALAGPVASLVFDNPENQHPSSHDLSRGKN